jgi:hypothetical protein
MLRADRRNPRLRRIAVAWLLAVGLNGVFGVAAAQAAANAHGCCPPPPAQAEAPPVPCPSLLPLACCDATTLPAPAHHAADLGGAVGAPSLLDLLASAPALALRAAPDPSPRASPLQLSVVLRV